MVSHQDNFRIRANTSKSFWRTLSLPGRPARRIGQMACRRGDFVTALGPVVAVPAAAVDEEARKRFLADPRGEARRAGLNEEEIQALEKIDRVGLELTAQSLKRKRHKHHRQNRL
jgi:hypothetical protein